VRAIDSGNRDLQIVEYRAGRKRTRERSRLRAADRGAIARDEHALGAASIDIGVRQPLPEHLIESELRTAKLGKLRLGLETEPDRDGVTSSVTSPPSCLRKRTASTVSGPSKAMEFNAVVDWDPGAPHRRHVTEPTRERGWRCHQCAGSSHLGGERRRVEYGDDLHAQRAILAGREIEERRTAAEHNALPDQAAVLLQQHLRAAERKTPGSVQPLIGSVRSVAPVARMIASKLTVAAALAADCVKRPILDAPGQRIRMVVDAIFRCAKVACVRA